MRHEEARARARAAGGEIVVVGNGAPQFIEAFRQEQGFQGRILTDPERGAYRLLELKRSFVPDPRTFLRAADAMSRGFRQTRTRGDASQLGGVLVVRPDGEMPYRFVSRFAGDHPPIEAMMTALEAAARPPA